MADETQHRRNKATSGRNGGANDRAGGDAVQQAATWGGPASPRA